MRENRVKRTLASGGASIGAFMMEFNTPGIGKILAGAGADFVVYDMEHTGWTSETIRRLLDGARSTSLVPVVRVPAPQYTFIAQTLDAGAMGLMIPMVETRQQAESIVESAKYPPAGRRGAAFGYVHDDYEPGNNAEKMRSANDEGLIIAQVETGRGVENADAIASVPGIDVLWIGHYDLTNSMGIPGQFDHPAYTTAVDEVLTSVRRNGKSAGIMAESLEAAQRILAQGFRMVSFGPDFSFFARALRNDIANLRQYSPEH